jgi:Rrf2 family protein
MLSKTGIHAVRALVELSRLPEGNYAGAATIAKEIGAPQNYLGKLLQQLSREGLLHSQKGLGGGFRLAHDPREISLLSVVEPLEHVSRWSGCILGNNKCSEENPCAIHDRWKLVRDAYLRFLEETTIADLIEQPHLALQAP